MGDSIQPIHKTDAYPAVRHERSCAIRPAFPNRSTIATDSAECSDQVEFSAACVILAATCDPPLKCAPPPPAAAFALRAIRLAESAARHAASRSAESDSTHRALRPWPFRWPIDKQIVETTYAAPAALQPGNELIDLIA